MNEQHQPVLLNEVLTGLAIEPDGVYLDATFGRGGHSAAILAQLGSAGRLFAADRDPDAVNAASNDKRFSDPRFCIQQRSFTELYDYMAEQGMLGEVKGILFDLGVSSPQLDNPERGFSFLHDGPLDMRMNPAVGLSAAEWLAQVAEADLCSVLKEYGEERYAKRIARAIVQAREQAPIIRTGQLSALVSAAHPHWERHKHPATRVFQAIRIAVNDELNQLESVLQRCIEVLAIGGRLAVISFHSLEDRSVKKFIQQQLEGGDFPRHLPIREAQRNIRLRRITHGIKPSVEEIAGNTRARSATLRVVEKIL